MTKRVLDIGNCAADHAAIARTVQQSFPAEVVPADTLDDAIDLLQQESFDLILVNRILDKDHSSGLGVIQQILSNPQTKNVPAMLITNYSEYQEEAVSMGAQPGFGKGELDSPAVRERLRPFLDPE